MNVLSLFDGMSCAQIALERAGIKVNKYYASEIDKYAIKVTQVNYPNTIQLGPVEYLKVKKANKNTFIWNRHIDWKYRDSPAQQELLKGKIDLLIGGSPCQGFSFAGRQLNFEDERSKLFFEFIRILKECNPKYFLLENVVMKKEYQDIISNFLGVKPIMINSALVSAQNRKRLYWTNIPNIEQPKDRNIYLKDIIEDGYCDREKSYCLDANYFKGGNLEQYFDKKRRQLVFCGAQRDRRINKDGKRDDYNFDIKTKQRIEIKNEPKSNTLSTVQKDNILCIQTGVADLKGFDCIKRTYDINGKSPTLTTMQGGHREPKITLDNLKWRKLTPLECERLQTVPDNYTNYVSNTQRYKMLGNGFTVDIISWILSFIH